MHRLVHCVALSLSQVVAFSVAAVCAGIACLALVFGVIMGSLYGSAPMSVVGAIGLGLLLAALPAAGAWYFFDLGWNARR